MANLVVLDQKSPEATVLGVFDFTSLLTNSQTISAYTATATVWAGTDPSPSAILGTGTISGTVVSIPLRAGVAGVIYRIEVSATASDGQIPILYGYLPVVEDPL